MDKKKTSVKKRKEKQTMKSKTSWTVFLRKYKWLIIILVAVLLLSIALFCLVFWSQLDDVSAWASIISGIFTYIGSSFLGIVVFYNSWVQTEIDKRLDEISLNVDAMFYTDDTCIRPFKKGEFSVGKSPIQSLVSPNGRKENDYSYICIQISNNNAFTPVTVSLEGLYFVNDNDKVEKIKSYAMESEVRQNTPIVCDKPVAYYYGFPNEIFPTEYTANSRVNVFVLLKVHTQKGCVKYYLEDYCFMHSAVGANPKILSEEEYESNMEKYGVPIELTWYHRQFFKSRRGIKKLNKEDIKR